MKKQIQHRAPCAVCGKKHATNGGLMVAHGYTIEYGQQNGNCLGAFQPHYGHKAAPAFIQKTILSLTVDLPAIEQAAIVAQAELEALPADTGRKARREAQQKATELKHKFGAYKDLIEFLGGRLADWSEFEPEKVDVLALEAEERKQRQNAAEEKKQAKATAEVEKQARAAEREEKARLKLNALLSADQYRQLLWNGEVIEEWQAEHRSERELFEDATSRLKAVVIKKCAAGELSIDDALWGSYPAVFRSRTESGKKGRQTLKQALCIMWRNSMSDQAFTDLVNQAKVSA